MIKSKILTFKEIGWSIIIALLLFTCMYYFLKNYDWYPNILSTFGVCIAMVGFYLAFRQIHSLKAITEHTNKEIRLRLAGFNRTFFISEVAQKSELLKNLKSKIRERDYLSALHIMEDFKSILATLSQHQTLLEIEIDNEELSEIIMNYKIDMSNIEYKIDKQSYKLKDVEILTNTDRLLFFLKNVESKLKI